MMWLLLFPIISFFLLFCICFSKLSGNDGIYTRIRIAFLQSFLTISLFTALSTEILSYSEHIVFAWVAGAWIVFGILLLSYTVFNRTVFLSVPGIFKSTGIFFWKNPVLLVIPVILAVSTVIAILYPTNNYDSLTYHMARVEHWISNKSISHYQTHIVRQLLMPPLGEWLILHAQLLSGTDRFANCIQTIFFAGSILQASLIAKSLGGETRMQVLCGLFTGLIPMAIIQSNTTQNDIIVAYFVLAFVYYAIEITKKITTPSCVFAGVSLGLAMLTKGTAYLFCVIFCGWFFLMLCVQYRKPLWKIIKMGFRFSTIFIIAIAINYGHFYRNIFLSGSITGDATKWVSNEGKEAKYLAVVGIKNIMNHMPVTGSMKQSLSSFAFNHGIDIDDPRYNYNTMSWMAVGFSYHEDYAQNFLHTILIAICIFIFFFRKRVYTQKADIWILYIATCIIICILFTILFKWQPWSNRLETAIFMLFCPLLASVVWKLKPIFLTVIILPFMYFATNALTKSARHPLLPVEANIFNKPYDAFIYNEGMMECKKYLDTCSSKSFGIFTGRDSPDYVYYKMMAESKKGRRPMEHIFVENESSIYLSNLMPETIISVERRRESYEWLGRVYIRTKLLDHDGPSIFTLQ